MKKDDAIKAVDDACAASMGRLFDTLLQGLTTGEKAADLVAHFRNGLAFRSDAHGKATAAIEDYFRSFK